MFVLSLVKKHYRLQFYMVSGLLSWPPASSSLIIDVAGLLRSGTQYHFKGTVHH